MHHQTMTAPPAANGFESTLGVVGVPLRPYLRAGVRMEAVAWAREGSRQLLALGRDYGVEVYEVQPDTETARPFTGGITLADPAGPPGAASVTSLAWTRLGSVLLLAAGNSDGRIHLWQVQKGSFALEQYGEPVADRRRAGFSSVAWVRANKTRSLLAAASRDGHVYLWQVRRGGDHSAEPLGHPLPANDQPGGAAVSVAWARDGARLLLAAASLDGPVFLWQVQEDAGAVEPFGQPLTVSGVAGGLVSVAWARDGGRLLLAATTHLGPVFLWEVNRDREEPPEPNGRALDGPRGEMGSLAWVREGSDLLLAAAHGNNGVHLWRLREGADKPESLGRSISASASGVWSVAMTRDGSGLLLAAAGPGGVHLWRVHRTRAVPRLPGYRSDGLGEQAVDTLDRDSEARAVAELVTARTARPPLAVGLFGDWGEGKSHFLELLRRQVAALGGSPLACRHVREVRFNAWHYAETSLWASLVSELFAQLAAQPHGDAGVAQRQLSRLAADLVAQRRVRERLAAARQRRDDLKRALRRPEVPWRELDAAQRRTITEAAGDDLPAEIMYRESVSAARILLAAAHNAWTLLSSAGRRAWLWFALALVASVALPVAIGWAWPHLSHWPFALSGLVFLGTAYRSAATRVSEGWKHLSEARSKIRRAVETLRAPLMTAVDVATAEVAALEQELQNLTAAGQLAGLIGERAAAGDYRGQLGLMTQIREDFHRMARLLAQASQEQDTPQPAGSASTMPPRDEAQDELPQIDRIVIYIDDLDRCPPARVMEMLEAVHLLLAVELFVVVVAIDPRWLLRSVAAHYRDVLQVPSTDPDDPEHTWTSTPAQYLEKIFQVVLTLPTMDDTGYARMLDTLITVHGTARSAPAPAPVTNAAPATTSPSGGAAGPGQPVAGRDSWEEDLYGPAVEELPVVELTDPLTFTEEEAQLLCLVGPPHLPLTPRSVKRLANSYGLLTALRQPHRDHDHAICSNPAADPAAARTHYRPYRAGLVLLAALVAFPALGPHLCQHLHQQADTAPESSWSDFLTGLTPQPHPTEPDAFINAFRLDLTSAQARQWGDLHTALRQITDTAAARGLYLPARLGPWLPWVIPAARLSFPAGQVVKSLWHDAQQRESDLHIQLRGRLAGNPGLAEASVYTSAAAEQHFTDHVLRRNRSAIDAWLADPSGEVRLILRESFDIATGRHLAREAHRHGADPVDVRTVQVTVERCQTDPPTYRVVKTEPAPDRRPPSPRAPASRGGLEPSTAVRAGIPDRPGSSGVSG